MAGRERKRRGGKRGRKASRYTAKTADKYELYELSVQSPEADVAFMRRVYKKETGRRAAHLREDFSGTALTCAEWIGKGSNYTAEAFDVDPVPVGSGRRRHFDKLGSAAARATLHVKDVREPSDRRPDVRCAQNFSYWVFKTRAELLDYFKRARADLAPGGIFVLDAHGGPESIIEQEDESDVEAGFYYVWDQAWFSPVTHDARFYIHFRFYDGTALNRAFGYDWRFWTIPEIRDALLEAGFSRVDVYWEGTAEDGESGNGIYRRTRHGSNDPAWVTYIVAVG